MYSAIQPGFKTIAYFYLSSSSLGGVFFIVIIKQKTVSSSSICMQGNGSLEQLGIYPSKLPNCKEITGILSLSHVTRLLHNMASFLPLTQLPMLGSSSLTHR